MSERTISVGNLNSFIVNLARGIGFAETDASVLASSLIDADLKGIRSHGVMRLPIYFKRIEAGVMEIRKNVKVIKKSRSIRLLDANHCLGQVAGVKGMEHAIICGEKYGVGICGIYNSNHFGALGYYTELASDKKMIGVAITNTFPFMAPTGGKEKVIGNNPFAISVPRSKDFPITYDVSTSTVAYGKILMAQKERRKIPFGWALDNNGQPTDDPDDVILRNGSLTPFEKHKGYGLAFILEILAGVLTGANFGHQIHSMYDLNEFAGLGHFMVAIDIKYFMDLDKFYNRLELFIESIKMSKLAVGSSEILIPGEIEQRIKAMNINKGLTYDDSIIEEINAIARKYSCNPLD